MGRGERAAFRWSVDRKIEVEIDAKIRRLSKLQPLDPAWKPVNEQLRQLQGLKAQSDALSPEQLQLLKAMPDRAPSFLKDPAWLFAKKTSTTAGTNLRMTTVDVSMLAKTVLNDGSAATKLGKATRLGDEWTDTTIITASNSGKVTIDPTDPSRISIDGRLYVVEPGSQIHVKNGDLVGPGVPLATEPPAQYRMVQIDPKGGGPSVERLEFYSTARKGWVQAGEHSTKRGAETERAARAQITADPRRRWGPNHALVRCSGSCEASSRPPRSSPVGMSSRQPRHA